MANQAEASAPPPIAFIDDPHAPEVFASEAIGFFLHHGNVSITFCAPRVDHSASPGPVNRVVIGRLVMPVTGAQELAVGLYNFLKNMSVNPVPKPVDPQQIQ